MQPGAIDDNVMVAITATEHPVAGSVMVNVKISRGSQEELLTMFLVFYVFCYQNNDYK